MGARWEVQNPREGNLYFPRLMGSLGSPHHFLPLAFPLLRLCSILEATGRTVPSRSAFLEGSQWPIAAQGTLERELGSSALSDQEF